MRRTLALVMLLASASLAHAQPLADPALEAKAEAINARVMALDTHVDIPEDFATAAMDPGGFTTDQVDLPKMRAGGLDAAFFIVYTPQGPLTPEGYADAKTYALNKLNAIHRFTAAYPNQIGLALTSKDARALLKSGRKAAFIGMENPYPLGDSVADVPKWAKAGVRYMGITHFGHNQFGDSANPADGEEAERYGGLSDLGRQLIPALNRAGIMIDVSHAGRKTMMQAVALSRAPVIASHSGVAALADNPRNLDDEQLRAIARNGGVAQIVAVDVYLRPLTAEQKALQEKIRKEMHLETEAARDAMSKETEAEYNKRLEAMWAISRRANVSDLVDAIDHAVKIAGIDHVGIASDFDGGGGVDGWNDASETINVTRELVKRGYSEDDIAKIWGGNLLRVLDDVQKIARKLQKENR